MLSERFTESSNLLFLGDIIIDFLEYIPFAVTHSLWFPNDGSIAYFSCPVRDWLDMAPGRWIEPGGPALWLLRLPDLTHMDFLLFGYLKEMLYRSQFLVFTLRVLLWPPYICNMCNQIIHGVHMHTLISVVEILNFFHFPNTNFSV